MMLDQQYPMEHAFRGPAKVSTGSGRFEPAAIAAADPEEFAAMCSTPPAIHRFPGSMAARLQELARIVEETYDGDAARLWTEAADGADLLKRVMALPGFGKQKAQIFVALLAKQLGVRPDGLGGGGRATTPWTATARWPTWWTRSPCSACATSRSRRRPRPRPAEASATAAPPTGPVAGLHRHRGRMNVRLLT